MYIFLQVSLGEKILQKDLLDLQIIGILKMK